MTNAYRVQLALSSHVAALPAVERAAARLFEGYGLPESLLEESTGLVEFEEAQREGLLWVALGPEPVGFALAEVSAEGLHLEELDVHPEHGRRGLGRRLLSTLCDAARERGVETITLTTFREVPWNEPFYASVGFEQVPAEALSAELSRRVREEAERGLDPDRRVVMRFVL